jgi:hypothetical protein
VITSEIFIPGISCKKGNIYDDKNCNLILMRKHRKHTQNQGQHYGIDFYGIQGGEILVMVDLFTRETILEWLSSRKQETVVQTIMRRHVFERGVSFSIRSDNAPELMRGIVKQLCNYLNVAQILTGGHNPRGNAICERANQTLGARIRKLNDHEYK